MGRQHSAVRNAQLLTGRRVVRRLSSVELRDQQRRAVEAAVEVLAYGGRAQVVMACGTGKTLVGRAVAARLAGAAGLVGVLVPSLALLVQTLRGWRESGMGGFQALGVCSEEIAAGEDADPDAELSFGVSDAGGASVGYWDLPVTTDSHEIAAWLSIPAGGAGLRVVFATYQSAPRIAEAFHSDVAGELPCFDLLVFDEAYRTAADPEAPFATALHDRHIPSARRLFLTATPRVQIGDPDAEDGGAEVFVGIDDEELFGCRVFILSVAEAIEAGMLSDYRVLVVGVTDAEVHKLVLDNAPLQVGPADTGAAMLAVQVALAGAAREFDLRRILVFCGRVATSTRFVRTLPHTIDALPPDRRPDARLTVAHVDGTSSATDREQAIADLTMPVGGSWTVVSNVKVLSEGVDCPALDAVVFADPRSGQIDVVQSVGRAIRLHPERDEPTVILLPVYLAPGESDEAVLDGSRFRGVWQILRALRDHDAELGAQIVRARRALVEPGGEARPVLPDRISIRLPEGANERFLSAFTTRVLTGMATPHERGTSRLRAFVEEFGHACPVGTFVDRTGYRLGGWVAQQRLDQARGRLDLRAAAELAMLPGWTWHVNRDRFEAGLEAVRTYAERYGTAPSSTYVTDNGLRVGWWMTYTRGKYWAGKLTTEQQANMKAVPGWTWDPAEDTWRHGFDALSAYATAHGDCDVAFNYRAGDGFALGQWLSTQIRSRERTPEHRRVLLEALPGWTWTWRTFHNRFETGLAALRAYAEDHGGPPPVDCVADDGFRVGSWVASTRSRGKTGRLTAEQMTQMEAVPGWKWDPGEDAWRHGFTSLIAYADEHKHCDVPQDHQDADGYALGTWVKNQARYRKRMSAERRELLEAVPGWAWTGQEIYRNRMVVAVEAFHAANGAVAMPENYATAADPAIGSWMTRQRRRRANGRIDPDTAALLEAIPDFCWRPANASETAFATGLASLRAYFTVYRAKISEYAL
jgi:superfamily II DNA or RNA helicase